MNREPMRELLTAALDGVLPSTERKTVQRLLHESAEARTLFAQLKRDAGRLKTLPKMSAPVDLASSVLNQIQENGITPTPLPPKPAPAKRPNWGWLPVWTNIITAASVLLLVSIGSYLYFIASQDFFAQKKNAEMAAHTGPRTVVESSNASADPSSALPLPPENPLLNNTVADASVPKAREVGPTPRVVEPDIHLSNVVPRPEIDFTQLDLIRVAQLFKVNELPMNESLRKKLVTDCKRDELIRLDLFCKLTPKTVEVVQNAFKAKGITFLVDAYAQERLKKNQETEIVFFTELLTPEEVAQVLTSIGADDNKANGAGGYDTLVVAPFLHADLETLGRLLGISNVLSKLPKVSANPIDIRKPLPEGTALQLAQTLSKMGSTGSTTPKEERMGIAVAYRPSNPAPANSKEIKQFLSRRSDKQPETKPLMLVLRTVK